MTDTSPPSRFAAADTVRWQFSTAAYPASSGWSMTWRLVGQGIGLTIQATADGDAYAAEIPAAQSALLTPAPTGTPCVLLGFVMRDGERFEVYRAECLVLPDPLTATSDLRGRAARTLAAIEAMLEGRASKDQMSYKIGDRELARLPIPDLLLLRDRLRQDAQREADAEALAQGRTGRPRRILVRMGRA